LQFNAVPLVPAFPLLTELMVTGMVSPAKTGLGMTAKLTALSENGPTIPGPDRKKPKASFTEPQTYSLYSSEPKM